jgi:hypothetical protein
MIDGQEFGRVLPATLASLAHQANVTIAALLMRLFVGDAPLLFLLRSAGHDHVLQMWKKQPVRMPPIVPVHAARRKSLASPKRLGQTGLRRLCGFVGLVPTAWGVGGLKESL